MPFLVRPFVAADYLAVAPQIYPWLGGEGFPSADQIAGQFCQGPAWTGVLDGHLIGAAGVTMQWPGVGAAWALVTDLGRQHPMLLHRAVVRHLRQIIETHGLRRVETTVLEGSAAHRRWVEAMGFVHEATMLAWGPMGETAYRYVLFPVRYETRDGAELAHQGGRDFVRVGEAWRPVLAGGADFGISETVIAYSALAAAAVGTATAAYGSYAQGQQAEGAQKYNAKTAENQAQAARNAAEVAASNKEEQYRRILATQRSRIGGSGVTTEGSPLLAMMDSAQTAALDVARIRYGGELQASSLDQEAILRRYMGKQAKVGGSLAAGGSLLQGVASAAYAYGRAPRAGGPTVAQQLYGYP